MQHSLIKRRRFLERIGGLSVVVSVGLLSGCAPFSPLAPNKKIAHVGLLDSGAPGTSSQPTDALIQGLRESGWVEGDNLQLEHRYEDGDESHLPRLVNELINLHVDVLVAFSTQGARAARQLNLKVPVVFTGLQDPVGAGLIDSLARPGGSLTGTTMMTPQLHGKRLELLKAIVPGFKKVAVLGNPTSAGLNMPEIEAAATPLNLEAAPYEARTLSEIAGAFDRIAQGGAQALMVLPDALFYNNRPAVVGAATRIRIADMYWAREFVPEGGLIAYGASRPDAFKRAAVYVDKILRGVVPADLPVEQPLQFDFAINLPVARSLGLNVPEALLTQATELITDKQ